MADRVVMMSARPESVVAEISVTLSRPRSWDVVLSEACFALKRQVLEILRSNLPVAEQH